MIPRVNSYFSGAGLMDLGLLRAGLDVQLSVEIDETCCASLRRNFGHQVQRGDMRAKLAEAEPECDVMAATYPCTRYAYSAAIHGHLTGDELYLHFFRHVAINRPEAYLLENVPGMKKFPVVMEAMTRLPDYYVRVVCPVRATTWLPQRRDRLIIIGTKRAFDFREPEPQLRPSLADLLEADPAVQIPDYVARRIQGAYRDQPIVSDPAAGDIAPTCVAHYSKDLSTRLVRDARYPHGLRPYTVREYARLQGVPDSFEFAGTAQQSYRQIGNGVAVPMAEWAGREMLRYFAHGHGRGGSN